MAQVTQGKAGSGPGQPDGAVLSLLTAGELDWMAHRGRGIKPQKHHNIWVMDFQLKNRDSSTPEQGNQHRKRAGKHTRPGEACRHREPKQTPHSLGEGLAQVEHHRDLLPASSQAPVQRHHGFSEFRQLSTDRVAPRPVGPSFSRLVKPPVVLDRFFPPHRRPL